MAQKIHFINTIDDCKTKGIPMDQENLQSIEDIKRLKQDVQQLQRVDAKLEHMNNLMVQIRDSMVNSHASLARHDLTLDEIRIGADFRKRESESSVREIKSQMGDMEHGIDSKMTIVVDTIIDRINTFEATHQASVDGRFNVLKDDINDLKKRVALVERWNGLHLTMLVIVAAVVLLLP